MSYTYKTNNQTSLSSQSSLLKAREMDADAERKTERKRKRFAARLKSSKGIVCTETPGPNIVLCNAGRATGLERDDIDNLIQENFLEMQTKFISEKAESHSFLVFGSTENAVSFFNACHGKAKVGKDGTPLYLNFVENVPDTEVICSYEDPNGLTILNNFITSEEEILFMHLFDWTEEASNLKNRQVKHYGYEFRYGSNDVDLDRPLSEKIPLECDILWKRLEEQGFSLGRPDQLTVNKYSPGHGIPSHVDRHSPFGSTVLSLSLGSSVVMDWKHRAGKSVPIVLPARSMLIMQDEARYDWLHGIQNRTTDPVIKHRIGDNQKPIRVITDETRQRETRISLTFRWTRRGACECRFKALCDSEPAQQIELDDSVASALEELHVHQVYEQIAGHFSSTRHTPWPRVVQFVRDVAPGTVVLDLGAGNGKNVLTRDDILQIAGERSGGLLSECAAHTRGIRAADCVRLDVLNAGIKDACADVVICIAVIHHMSTKARRIQAISTIHRLLRPSGKALITVWAKDQSRSNYLSKNKVATENAQVSVNGVNLHIHENRTQFLHKDLLVPWKLKMRSKVTKSDDKISKTDGKMSKTDDRISKNYDKMLKSVDKLSKSDDVSKSDYKVSKSGDKVSKSDGNMSKTDILSEGDIKSSNRDNKLTKSNKLDNTETLLRFYHVFEEGELDDLCREVGFEIDSNFYEEGNWCVVCRKVQ